MYTDNVMKFTCVLNSRTPLPQALNAVGHALVGLTGRLAPGEMKLLEYPFREGRPAALISRHPIIVLQARNSNQLRTLVTQAGAKRIACNVFAGTMLGSSAAEQRAQTAAAGFDDVDVFAVALFGAAVELDAIARKFSVFKTPGGNGETFNVVG